MGSSPPEWPPVLVEKGENPKVLIIVFTGFLGQLMMHPLDFLQVSGLLKYSRILLRDDSRSCYLGGIEAVAPGFEGLLSFLRERIAELAPEKIMTIGTSGGGAAALLAGHELKVHYVHAFSPFTYVDGPTIQRYNDQDLLANHWDALQRVWALPRDVHRLFDIRKVLMAANGVTRYYVHVCQKSPIDLTRAVHLVGCPNVSVITYPCDGHRVALFLARQQVLVPLLKIENQEDLAAILLPSAR